MKTVTPLIPPPYAELATSGERRIRIGAQVGRGSVATVYRAVHESPFGLRRVVAVKIFDPLSSDEHEVTVATLAHAARDAACVQHPNVVAVHDFGLAAAAQPYLVTDLVDGRPLAALLDTCARQGRRIPLDVALFIGIEMCEALAGARLARTPDGVQVGVVHGELSATDVLLAWNGDVKVSDFGLAAATRASSGVRSVRALARRIRSLAPEVARGHFGDARSDVFSLGVVLREMLIGPRFAPHTSDNEALAMAREGVVQSGVFEPQLANELRMVIARALEREPPRRHAHAGVLAYDLRKVALSMGVGDGRGFLRYALPKLFVPELPDAEGPEAEDDAADLADTGESPRASRVQSVPEDRFARLRGEGRGDDDAPEREPTSGLMRKAPSRPSLPEIARKRSGDD